MSFENYIRYETEELHNGCFTQAEVDRIRHEQQEEVLTQIRLKIGQLRRHTKRINEGSPIGNDYFEVADVYSAIQLEEKPYERDADAG